MNDLCTVYVSEDGKRYGIQLTDKTGKYEGIIFEFDDIKIADVVDDSEFLDVTFSCTYIDTKGFDPNELSIDETMIDYQKQIFTDMLHKIFEREFDKNEI